MPTDRSDPGCSEQTCAYAIWHGPGHQSRTTCQVLGEHTVHHAVYGSMGQFAEWEGDNDVFSGFFDEPPRLKMKEGTPDG